MATTNILNYSNDKVIAIHCARTGVPADLARVRFDNLIDYLCGAGKADSQVPPSKDVDEVWHDFLLCSRDYREFCTTHLGVFIDHVPLVGETTNAVKASFAETAKPALCVPSRETAALCVPSK